MKWAVVTEPADQDVYDMMDLSECEVVEADDKDEAIYKVVGDMLGYIVFAYRVNDNMPLGSCSERPEALEEEYG